MRYPLPVALALALAVSLATTSPPRAQPPTTDPALPRALEDAPRDAVRLPFPADARELVRDLDAWTSAHPRHRAHIALDRPLYRPGNTVSVKVWHLAARGLAPTPSAVSVQLLDPRGLVAQKHLVAPNEAGATAFALGEQAPGGEWIVRVITGVGEHIDRPFTVASFETPRIQKTLDFAREGYGPGASVAAALSLARATGEPLADLDVEARVSVGGERKTSFALRTDARGEATVRFDLPPDLDQNDVMLTVLVDDGGVTESISRPVPIRIDRVNLALFPEGGDLVRGLTSRVYFEATDASGSPSDVSGALVDDRGETIARIESASEGRGRFTYTPDPQRSYAVHLDGRDDTPQIFPLPEAADRGCVLRHHDDLDGALQAVRVSVACTDDREVVVLATQHEQTIDYAAVAVRQQTPTTVHLRSRLPSLSGAQGVARVTVLDDELQPLAERLVYRNRGRRLGVTLTPDRRQYAPGDEVTLDIHTTGPDGAPVAAALALTAVDDALLSFADDDEHTLASRVLLAAELPEPIEDAATLFDPGQRRRRARAGPGPGHARLAPLRLAARPRLRPPPAPASRVPAQFRRDGLARCAHREHRGRQGAHQGFPAEDPPRPDLPERRKDRRRRQRRSGARPPVCSAGGRAAPRAERLPRHDGVGACPAHRRRRAHALHVPPVRCGDRRADRR